MKRILFMEEAPSIGGSLFSLLQLASGLDRSRFQPFVLFRYDLPVRNRFGEAGIPNATLASIKGRGEKAPPGTKRPLLPAYKKTGPYRFLRSVRQYLACQRAEAEELGEWISDQGFALVHGNNSVAVNIPLITAAQRTSVPAVSHQRGFFRLTAFQRFLARGVGRFLCVSRAVAEHYVREGLPASKVEYIYNGIDLEAVRPAPETSAGKRSLTVGWFGRLDEWKGAATLIDAAMIVLGERPDVRFMIAGTGPEEGALRGRIEVNPLLSRNISFLGYRKDTIDLLSGCDLAVQTSIEPEPLSRSALEALACGIPVVASDCGGTPEIVEDGRCGLLVEPGNPVMLADAILKLAGNDDMRASFGKEARRRAESLFSAERYVKGVEGVYDAILGS